VTPPNRDRVPLADDVTPAPAHGRPFRIAHVSDTHVLSPAGVEWRRILFNKRITGYANLVLKRGRVYRREYLDAVLAAAAAQADHVVVTGDITNLALEGEFDEALALFGDLGRRVEITVVPGNHDIYLPSIHRERRFPHHFGSFLESDLPQYAIDLPAGRFPCVKLRGPTAIIALSSAVPRPPFVSAGHVGAGQLQALAALLDRAVAEEPPVGLKEGGLLRRGYSEELDRVAALADDGKGFIARLEAEERARTGIASLKVRYNKVFGYYLEVTKPNLHLVPKDWERRQTTVGGERFVTAELKAFEEKVLSAEEQRCALEERLFEELRQAAIAQAGPIRTAAGAVAVADALLSLARAAAERGYSRPEVDSSEVLEILDGRHPVVEALLPEGPAAFVPNDVRVAARGTDGEPGQDAAGASGGASLLVITGPNMAGKSTVMRQAALIALLAQMGSFVPARRARVGLLDRIFTRVGASDDLARGRSTFMVEMTETAAILHNATPRSLVVLDEIGRGTSTFDGLSIAWAVAEHLHDVVGCRTMFATHYHELQDLARERPAVKNLTVAVREVGEQVVFLRKLVEGGASRSYGIEVAKLAGLPAEVLARAREILRNLEAMEVDERGHAALAHGGRHGRSERSPQLGLFASQDPAASEMLRALEALDVDALRPIDALNLIAGWKRKHGR
jgi:DNA mismatch repair protein MutS